MIKYAFPEIHSIQTEFSVEDRAKYDDVITAWQLPVGLFVLV